MTSENPSAPEARKGEGTASPPEGSDPLDDLLRELSEVEGPSPDPGTGSAESLPPESSPGGAGATLEPESRETSTTLSSSPTSTSSSREPGKPSAPAASEALGELRRALEFAQAENQSLRAALSRQQEVEVGLRKEVQEAKVVLEDAKGRLAEGPSRFLPAAPVAFLSSDGKSVQRRAFYTLGRGEALEEFLNNLFAKWTKGGAKLVPTYDQNGLLLTLEWDREKRYVRVMNSGIYLVHLSSKELQELGEIPALVRKGKAPA